MHAKTQKLFTLLLPLFLVASFVVASPFASADPPTVQIKCKDGKTVTAHRSGSAFTTKDYENACKNHGGYKTPTAPKQPSKQKQDPIGGNCMDISKCDLMTKYAYPFINFLAALVGLVVVISVIIGGIQYGSSAGDPQAATAARKRIQNAIIALVTFIFLYALLNFLVPGGLFNK